MCLASSCARTTFAAQQLTCFCRRRNDLLRTRLNTCPCSEVPSTSRALHHCSNHRRQLLLPRSFIGSVCNGNERRQKLPTLGASLDTKKDTTGGLKEPIAPVVAYESLVTKQEIKFTLQQHNLPFSEKGYTQVRVKCPQCKQEQETTETQAYSLHINTTTGFYWCVHCQNHGNWKMFPDTLRRSEYSSKQTGSPSSKQRRRRRDDSGNRPGSANTVLSRTITWPEADSGAADLMPAGDVVNGFETVEYRNEMAMVDSLYSDAVTLNQLPHTILTDLRRLLRIPGKVSNSSLSHYGVVGLSSRDGLIFPRYIFRRTEGSTQQPAGLKIYRLEGAAITEDVFPRHRFGGLFGYHLIDEDLREVILTASEVDALSVYQDTKKPTIALPRGIQELPQEALPYLEQFDRIIIWFPSDKLSWEKAKRFAIKLGQSRCFFIRPRDKFPAPSDWLAAGKSVTVALDKAEPIVHKAVEVFPHLRDAVWEEFLHKEQRSGMRWRRYPRLNMCLKGFRPGELTILTGPTGSGKTTFLSEYSLDLAEQGVNTLWGSFEISNVRLARMMLIQFARIDLSKETEDKFEFWADKFERLPIFFMRFHGASATTAVADAVKHAIYTHDIQHVIIDNVQFMMGMQYGDSSDRFFTQDRIVEQFRQLASGSNVHVSLVVHPRKENPSEELTVASIFGGVKASQEADNIMIIQQLTMDRDPYLKKYLQIVKNRYDGDLVLGEQLKMVFNRDSLGYTLGKAATEVPPPDGTASTLPSPPQNKKLQPAKLVGRQTSRTAASSRMI